MKLNYLKESSMLQAEVDWLLNNKLPDSTIEKIVKKVRKNLEDFEKESIELRRKQKGNRQWL